MPRKKSFPLLAALLLAFLLCIRLILITADPPYDLSTSGGPYGDPGGYSFNARNKVLFGTWEVDDYNMMYLSFPPHLVTYFSFKLLGVGLAQQNLVPVLFSTGSLFLFFLILRRRFAYAWALAGTGILGINYLFLMYSRVANRVMPPIFFILLGVYFLQKETRKAGPLLAAGTSFFLAFISKSVVFYVLIAIGTGYLIFILLHHKIKDVVKQIALLAAGVVVPGIPWLLFIYIPHRDFIHSFSELNIKFLIPPAQLSSLIRNFWTRPPILVSQMPIICVLAALASLIMLLKLVQQIKKIPLVDWIFLIWFLLGYVYYALIQQRVPRHVVPQIVPLISLVIFFAHRFISTPEPEREKTRFSFGIILFLWLLFPISLGLKGLTKLFPYLFSSQKSLNFTLFALSMGFVFLFSAVIHFLSSRKNSILSMPAKRAIVFVLMAAVVFFHGSRYLRWASRPQFQFKEASQDLGKAFAEATIAGLWAPVICLENKHRAHEYFPGAINDYKDFLPRFGITHIFTTTHAGEDKKFEQNFPEAMAQARLLARYHIWTVEALLYDIKPTQFRRETGIYEAELYTQKGNTPRFDSEASGNFAVLSRGKKSRFVLSVPSRKRMLPGTYRVTFQMKKHGSALESRQRLARIDAVVENRKKAIALKDIYPRDLDTSVYRRISMIFRIKSAEDITFRVFSQGKGDFWVDRIDVQKID
jgi:4-amino-4-deoxy-L-arabinose transferase-like glycosyltransferase